MNKFDTSFSFRGQVVNAQIHEPVKKYGDDFEKMILEVDPTQYNCGFTYELDQRVERYKQHLEMNCMPNYDQLFQEELQSEDFFPRNKDIIHDGLVVTMQTIKKPTFYNNVHSWLDDEQWKGKYVKVKGNIHVIQPDGNAFLSFHIVDSIQPPKSQFEIECMLNPDAPSWDF